LPKSEGRNAHHVADHVSDEEKVRVKFLVTASECIVGRPIGQPPKEPTEHSWGREVVVCFSLDKDNPIFTTVIHWTAYSIYVMAFQKA